MRPYSFIFIHFFLRITKLITQNWGTECMFCEFRANVRAREKLEKSAQGGNNAKSTNSAPTNVKKSNADKGKPGDKAIYCNDYNKGTCTLSDHHQGKYNGKLITRWHICKKCLLEGKERKSHPENDANCSRKG